MPFESIVFSGYKQKKLSTLLKCSKLGLFFSQRKMLLFMSSQRVMPRTVYEYKQIALILKYMH